MTPVSRFQITYRDILVGCCIMLLAYALRVVVVFDRAGANALFDPLPPGRDQYTYLFLVNKYEAGTWPREPFYYQPGVIYYFVGIRALVGDSLGMMRLVTSLTGALSCGLMVAVGWLLTGRRWGGYIAGLLLAIYPVAIFYSTVLLIPDLALFLVTVFLLLTLWQREKLAWWRSIGIGITLGLLLITRSNLIVLAITWFILLGLHAGKWRRFVAHALVFALASALMVSPVTLFNLRYGVLQLVTSVGADELYRGNNRDASGVYAKGFLAFDLMDDADYMEAFFGDIAYDPLRFVELELHKAGLFWSSHEPGNNISYETHGKAVSPLLQAIPLDFSILSAVGLLGLIGLWYQTRRTAVFMSAAVALTFASVMVIWVEGRVRHPIVPLLVATSAYLFVNLAEVVRAQKWRGGLRWRYVLPVFALVGVLLYLNYALNVLPVRRPVATLPDDIRPINLTYDGVLRLVGWRQLERWPTSQHGWGVPDRVVMTELYWEITEPTTQDYHVYLALIGDGERYAGFDRPIGSVSFRSTMTSQWQPGEIYRELVGFRLPQDAPLAQGLEIRLGVYLTEGEFTFEADNRVVIPVLPDGQSTDLILQTMAVFNPLPALADVPEAEAIFGGNLALITADLPAESEPGAVVELALTWQAIHDLPNDYVIFVHVMNSSGELVVQRDLPPDATLATSNWPPGYRAQTGIDLTMPDEPGVYALYAGLYRADTQERLTVDAPDNRLFLGEIRVEES